MQSTVLLGCETMAASLAVMDTSKRSHRRPAEGPPTEPSLRPRDLGRAADPRPVEGPPTEPAWAPPPADVPPYLRSWRRYRVLAQIGAGGMGEVYRAWDPQLHRWVALKFLHGSDSLRSARFQREAQAQARVDHPGVCRVYEVGEVEGRPYIAMQEIVGSTLGEAARELPLEERVRLVAQVADAVHAAHRIGLIHRDLKPSNVLVAWSEDGLHPFVVDFGLARDQRVTGLSVSGALSGTPGYMAPEQARGDDAAIDRRADVYSLGAVLYELVSGQRPLQADNLADAIVKLLQSEPVPLRQVAPAAPADLETVVMKCLERDPARRYDSARALAADLRRWLDGEPVEAQRASALYRLRKRAARHPRIVAAGVLAVLLIAALAGTALRTRWEATARADAARRFGTAAKEMESLLRVAELAPAHDTSRERAAVRAAMKRVERHMASMGGGARGAGLYALGRGALALGEAPEALAHLQAAWQAGERGPEVSYALGQALGQSYFDGLQRLSAVKQPAAEATVRRELERRFRDPARAQLRLAAAASSRAERVLDAPELVEALLALYEDRYDAARAAAERAVAGRPWLFEARQLQGLAWRRQAEEATERGELDAAFAAFERARVANAAAMAIARSGAGPHAEECARHWGVLRATRMRRPLEASETAAAVAACDRALALDPQLARAWGDEGRVLSLVAEDQQRGGVDPTAAALRAQRAHRRQLNLERADDGWAGLGAAHEMLARWQLDHGIDPRPEIDRAIAAYRAAIAIEPRRATTFNNLGNALILDGRYRVARGLPAEDARRQAIAAFERSVALWDGFATAHANLGHAWTNVGVDDAAAGRDPRPALERAIAAFRRGVALNPSYPAYHNNQGIAHLTLGEYQLVRGEDPRQALRESMAAFDAALALKPQYSLPNLNLAYAHRLMALWQLRRGEDPAAELELAGRAVERARQVDPSDADVELEAAREALVEARWEIAQGRLPAAALRRAERAAAAGLARNAQSAELHLVRGERWRWEAEWRVRAGRSAGAAAEREAAIERGLDEVAKALATNPRLAEALALRAVLLRVRGDEPTAAEALAAARRLNPLVVAE